ncbi:MAG: class I SAM-dependent methyltransferase [Gaiellales bacterium]
MNWSERAQAYRDSPGHRSGRDLDTTVAWCDPGAGVTALDVATGGGHVADRLRELGCDVTTCDAAEGMQPDVVCPAEQLPFADASFDVAVCRIAAHHFTDLQRAVSEMARVSRRGVVIEDTLDTDERVEQAERLRDPTHVRNRTRDEWLSTLEAAGLRVTDEAEFDKQHPMDAWLARTGCTGDTAQRVRELLAHRTAGDTWSDAKVVFRAVRVSRE